jgi:hypothetical protein
LAITIVLREQSSVFEAESLEDFLTTIYQSLGEWQLCDDNVVKRDYHEYEFSRFERPDGTRVQLRILLLRRALYNRLRALKEKSRVFLVVDGIDCCSTGLRLLLDAELFRLQHCQVNVMITSRIAIYERRVTKCDHRDHEDDSEDFMLNQEDEAEEVTLDHEDEAEEVTLDHGHASDEGDPCSGNETSEEEDFSEEEEYIDFGNREPLDLFLKCKTCRKILCFDCHSAGRICGKW